MLIPLGAELPASCCCLTSLALITDPTGGSTLLESLLFLALEESDFVKFEATGPPEAGCEAALGFSGLSEAVLLLLALPMLTPLWLKTWVTLSMTLPVIKIASMRICFETFTIKGCRKVGTYISR